jgi:hypothetical protein
LRKYLPIVVVLICVAIGIHVLANRRVPVARESVPPVGIRVSENGGLTPQELPAAVPVVASPDPTAPEPSSRQHVFRLQLDRGVCSLEKMEEVTGDFRRERVLLWETGMLLCRLIAADGRIVGERTLHAPDRVCFVLDPNVDAAAPVASRLTPDGPTIFQVRFPQIADAVRIEIHRIASAERPRDTATAVGPLLASIPIPGK